MSALEWFRMAGNDSECLGFGLELTKAVGYHGTIIQVVMTQHTVHMFFFNVAVIGILNVESHIIESLCCLRSHAFGYRLSHQ